MKRAVWSYALVALALVACNSEGPGKVEGPGQPDPAMTLVELVRAQDVPANGSDTAIIRVVARDRDGRPVPNRTVEATSSNPNDEVVVQPGRTDKNGVSEIHVSATEVGSRVLTIAVHSLTIPQRPTIEFVPGEGSYLEFVEVPTIGKAGRPLRPAIRVEVKDAKGNRVSDYDGEVSLHVGDAITLTERATGGVVTFANVVIDEPGTEHRLRATAPGMPEARSDKIDIIVGDPAYLKFDRQPTDTRIGDKISVLVSVRDPAGNIVVGSNDEIRIRLYSNPTGTKLEGTLVARAQEGVATFDDLVIRKGSAGYQFTAAAAGYQSAESDVFTVLGGEPTKENSTLVIHPLHRDDSEPVAIANGLDRLRIEARLADEEGNAIAGQPVTLVASGTGHLFHPALPRGAEVLNLMTNGTGSVTAWISSTMAGPKTVTLRVGELFQLDADVLFVPDDVSGDYSELVPAAVTAIADLEDGIRFDVVAKDANDNPISGLVVGVTASGTSNVLEGLTGTSVITGEDGVGTFVLRSSKAEEKTVTVRLSDEVVLSHDVVFLAGPPDKDTSFVLNPSDPRITTVGQQIAEPFQVHVRDKMGNPVPQAEVDFEVRVDKVGGTLFYADGSPAGLTAQVIADDEGMAEISLLVGTQSGQNVVAWHGGWEGDEAADWRDDLRAIGKPDVPTTLELVNDPSTLTAVAGQAVPTLEFRARDQHGNYTGPADLSFAPSGDGSVSPTTVTIPTWEYGTRESPTAAVTWTLATTAGQNQLTVTSPNPNPGDPLELTVQAQGTAGVPHRIEIVNATSEFEQVVAGTVTEPLQVQVYDVNDNLVDDIFAVRFSIADFGDVQTHGFFDDGQHAPGFKILNLSSGAAQVTYTLGEKAGERTVVVSVEGFSSVPTKSFTITAKPDAPASMTIVGGEDQVAHVGRVLDEPLMVRIADQYDNPVEDVEVTFTLTSSDGPNAGFEPDGEPTFETETNGQGIASAAFRVGDLPGDYTVTVSANGLPDVHFDLEAILGEPATIEIVSGDGQEGIVDDEIEDPLVVVVKDDKGNLLPQIEIEFDAPGMTLDTWDETDADGETSVKVLKLPTVAGPAQVVASVATDSSLSVTFNLTAKAGPAHSLVRLQGDYQMVEAGEIAPVELKALVLDEFGNPSPDQTIEFFTVPAGAGLFLYDGDTTGVYPGMPTSDENGEVAVQWKVPNPVNLYTARARIPGDPVQANWVNFQVDVIPGPPAEIVFIQGQGGSASVDGSIPIEVEVRDKGGNPLDAVPVSFSLAAGTHDAAVVNADPQTNATGRATATVEVGTVATTLQLTVVADGDVSETIDLEVLPGPADELVLVSGDNQTGTVGAALAAPIVVRVVDAYDNPIANQTVVFQPQNPGEGSFDPPSVDTGANGEAESVWTLHTVAGTYQATISSGSLAPVIVIATAEPGDVAALAKSAGDGAEETVGGQVAIEVEARDAHGNLVDGVEVAFAVTSGDATLAQPSVTTSGGGKAANTVTFGTTAGAVEVTATANGVVATFGLVAEADVADAIAVESGDGQSGFVGLELADDLVVRVTDQHGNPVENEMVTFASADGTPNPVSVATDANGRASTRFKPDVTGPITVSATIASGTTTQADFTVTGLEPPASIEVVAGDLQRINPGEAFANPVVVRVLDANSDPVEGASVTFAAVGGTIVSQDDVTDAEGYATAFVAADAVDGDVTVTASADGFGFAPAVFDLVAEESLLCQAVGASTYYTDANGDLVARDWVDGEGTFRMAYDDANSLAAWVSFAEAVSGQPAFGYVHPSLALDCDGTTVEVQATATGAELSVDGVVTDWADPAPAGVEWNYDDTTKLFTVSCSGTPGVTLSAYDDEVEHFTRVLAEGSFEDSLCTDPPEVVELTAP